MALPNLVRLCWGLLRDRRVSRFDRLLFVATLAYVASPLDLIPDWLVVLGQLDDAFLLTLATRRLIGGADPGAIREHWRGDPTWLEGRARHGIARLFTWFLPLTRPRVPG